MTICQLTEWVKSGRELEFDYQGKRYSITYYGDGRKDYISFCEYYQETLDVPDVDTLWNSSYKDIRLSEMLLSVPAKDVDVA